jgi:hypothetical protein
MNKLTKATESSSTQITDSLPVFNSAMLISVTNNVVILLTKYTRHNVIPF